jgi:hypothetical protein
MIEWNIQTRAHLCRACARPFADRQMYHTLLFDERQAYERVDVCEECWSTQYNEGTSRKGFVSHWQGIFEFPPAPVDPIEKETAETLLRKLIQLNDPRYGAATFILAVMLERKRILKVKDQLSQNGRRVFVYEQPRTGDVFTIVDPDLHLDQLEEVQRDVGHLLQFGLPSPSFSTTTTETTAPAPSSAGAMESGTAPGADPDPGASPSPTPATG